MFDKPRFGLPLSQEVIGLTSINKPHLHFIFVKNFAELELVFTEELSEIVEMVLVPSDLSTCARSPALRSDEASYLIFSTAL